MTRRERDVMRRYTTPGVYDKAVRGYLRKHPALRAKAALTRLRRKIRR